MTNHPPWSIWADTGGTFTDAIGIDPHGTRHTAKVLSSGALRFRVDHSARASEEDATIASLFPGAAVRPLDGSARASHLKRVHDRTLEFDDDLTIDAPTTLEVTSGEPAPIVAARLITRTPFPERLPPAHVRLATTRGTNALLQRDVEPVALFVTQGFADLLLIGDQRRPNLFAVDVAKPRPYAEMTIEIPQRLAADGEILEDLDERAVESAAQQCLARGITRAGIALLHAWRFPAHERRVAEILRRVGFEHVSASSGLAASIRIVPRAITAVVNAALSKPVATFLEDVAGAFDPRDSRLLVMTSAGGLHRVDRFAPKDSLLSGPAAGVLGAATAGAESGATSVIAFDMGGTSTDVSRCVIHPDRPIAAGLDISPTHRVADAHLAAPALAIESVAAGGGSICSFRHGEYRVGPESAGASPGPACYADGGPLTITDVNLLLGRLDESRFQIPVSREHAERAARHVHEAALAHHRAHPRDADPPSMDGMLEGFIRIANERMADAIQCVSTRKGFDPAASTLVAFGGAGAQHAAAIAELLAITRVVIPVNSSLLSAVGLGAARPQRRAETSVLAPLADHIDDLDTLFDPLEEQAGADLETDGVPRENQAAAVRSLRLRFEGQEHAIAIEAADPHRIETEFLGAVERLFGHVPAGKRIEIASASVTIMQREATTATRDDAPATHRPAAERPQRVHVGGQWIEAPLIERSSLVAQAPIAGPAMVVEATTTTLVEPGWSATADDHGALVLTRSAGAHSRTAGSSPTPIRNELIANRLTSIATEMGEMLERTALSTNVKERRDFSCVITDENARLATSAPHLPVHLGALGLCVSALLEHAPMNRGDMIVTNHPAYGGSHLPDVTVVAPVFSDQATLPIAYVAARAHHAEIGGIAPGSMPPAATTLGEEGVVIPPTNIATSRGAAELRRLLAESPHPTRSLDENLADIDAAVAALRRGIEAIARLAAEESPEALREAMRALHTRADAAARRAMGSLGNLDTRVTEHLDGGGVIELRATARDGRLTLDFEGTSPVQRGNLNTPLAVTRSAVMYAIRLLAGEDLPLNDGLLDPVTLVVPSCMLNPVFSPGIGDNPAIAGGNVETSQRVTNALMRALGLAASSQGTMNNVLFGAGPTRGRPGFGYYETIAGGCGASANADGASGTHSHMTNTAITDPEILEHRYPVRLVRFGIRRGSGGAGARRGGDGVVRELEFLAPVTLSVITQHRNEGPEGLCGGGNGAPGRQWIVRRRGGREELGAIASAAMEAGDRLVIETPGGGGHGKPA